MDNTNSNRSDRKWQFRWQAFTSLLLFAIFLLVLVSGVVLYISPRGRVANWTGWSVLGLDKEGWASFHTAMASVFLVVALIHLCLNWRMFWGYIKKKAAWSLNLKVELVAAAIGTTAVAAAALSFAPPFGAIVAGRSFFRDYWESHSPAAPVPHAEEFTLQRLARIAGVSVDQIVDALDQLGAKQATAESTLAQAAADSGTTPNRLFRQLAEQFPQLSDSAARGPRGGFGPGGMGPGFGWGGGMGPGFGRGRYALGQSDTEDAAAQQHASGDPCPSEPVTDDPKRQSADPAAPAEGKTRAEADHPRGPGFGPGRGMCRLK